MQLDLIKNPILLLLLLIANDVESNPGPPNPEAKLASLEKESLMHLLTSHLNNQT